MEYASSVWAPFKSKHIELIEGVQRRATKQLPSMKGMTYEERLRKLKLPTLSYRRIRGGMIEVYKMLHGKYDQKAGNLLKLWPEHSLRTGTRGNSKKLFTRRARLDVRKHSSGVRVVQVWNSLPEKVVSANSLNTFKNRLDNYWKNQ